MIAILGGGGLSVGALRPLVAIVSTPSAIFAPPVAVQRGWIRLTQTDAVDRTGNGTQWMVWNVFGPGSSSSTGSVGQTAYDVSGNFYWCYATNQWARIGPAGYSNTF